MRGVLIILFVLAALAASGCTPTVNIYYVQGNQTVDAKGIERTQQAP